MDSNKGSSSRAKQPIIRKSIPGPAKLSKIQPYGMSATYDKYPQYGSDLSLPSMQESSMLEFTKTKKIITTIDGKIKIVNQIDGNREFLCCKYDEEFNLLAGGFPDGTVKVYNSKTGDLDTSLTDKEIEFDVAPVTSIQHRPVSTSYPLSNTFTCSYANGCIKCWNHKFKQCIYTIREKRQTFGLTYHPNQPKFLTYGDNLKIYLYDEETKIQERIFASSNDRNKHDGPMSHVFAACFNPRSQFEILTGGWDNAIQFWDTREPYAVRHIYGLHLCGEGIDINNRGTEILVCSWQKENPLQLWDYGTAKLITAIEPDVHNSKLYCGKYCSKDFIMTGGNEPNLFRIVDLQTHVTVASINNLPGAVYSFALGPPVKPMYAKSEKQEPTRGSDLSTIPRIALVAGKKLYQIEIS